MADGPNPNSTPNGEGPSGKPLPLSVRLLAAGVRGARDVGKATGIDQAIEAAAEEAMVAAVESEAVERAIARVLKGPVVEEAMNSALESDAVKNALVEALDSELVDEVWRRLLASDEAQRLVERIAEAPEIRAAISAQSVGMIEDVGHTIGNGTRRLDSVVERVVRRIFFRKRRDGADRSRRRGDPRARLRPRRADRQPRLLRAGRGRGPDRLGLHRQRQRRLQLRPRRGDRALVRVRQPLPGRLLVARRPDAGHALPRRPARLDTRGLPLRRSIKRLIGMALAAMAFGLGFLGILFDKRRRAWDDRLSGVDVVYEGNERTPAPWSRLAIAEPPLVAEPRYDEGPGFPGPSVTACGRLLV